MFPKKVIAALCAAVLALAMPTMAFAYSGASGISGVNAQGHSWKVVAEYQDADDQDHFEALNITQTGTAPSNWNSGLYNPTGSFFSISADGTGYTEGDTVYIHLDQPASYIIPDLYVEHDNGTSEVITAAGHVGNVGDQPATITYAMTNLSVIGFGDTSAPAASDSGSSSGSGSSAGSQSGSAAGGTLSPKTGIDMDGQLFAIAACGIAAAGISVVAIRRMVRSK